MEIIEGSGGTLECWHKATATYVGEGSYLQYTWNFPAAFANSDVVVLVSRGQASANELNNSQILGGYVLSANSTGAVVRVGRTLGSGNFASGDTVQLNLYAKGSY